MRYVDHIEQVENMTDKEILEAFREYWKQCINDERKISDLNRTVQLLSEILRDGLAGRRSDKAEPFELY